MRAREQPSGSRKCFVSPERDPWVVWVECLFCPFWWSLHYYLSVRASHCRLNGHGVFDNGVMINRHCRTHKCWHWPLCCKTHHQTRCPRLCFATNKKKFTSCFCALGASLLSPTRHGPTKWCTQTNSSQTGSTIVQLIMQRMALVLSEVYCVVYLADTARDKFRL